MIDEKRLKTTPTQHIRNLMDSIRDGKLTVTYYFSIDPPHTISYEVSCDNAETDVIVGKYEDLTRALRAIGTVRDEINNGAKAEELLTSDQLDVWNTYIREFDEKFDVGENDLNTIYEMKACGAPLNEEEQAILERHRDWFETQSLTRLPGKARSPMYLVNRAQRYEYFVSMNAPEIVLAEEGRCLAEEMILYYCCV